MTINIISSGVDASFSTKLNSNFSELFSLQGLNTIRTLINRVGVWSKGSIDGWGEAYIDTNGREDSVDTDRADTTCLFDSNKYVPGGNGTDILQSGTLDASNATNTSYAFDGNDTTATTTTTPSGSGNMSVGKIFSATTVKVAYYKVQCGGSDGSASYGITLQSYNGSTWSTIKTIYNDSAPSSTIEGLYIVDASVQGLRIQCTWSSVGTNDGSGSVSYLEAQTATTTGTVIKHAIPTGTFSSTISKCIGVPLISNWETGANIDYKLTNATEDSGWLSCGVTPSISSFTAFASEPTTLFVRLTPKSSSPTSGYPGVYGFWVRAV